MRRTIALVSLLAAGVGVAQPVDLPKVPVSPAAVEYRSIDVDGVNVFYREAGRGRSPTLLLLHGFPSSSFMFRELIPRLADRYHVVAPDYPGFGQSDFPPPATFAYTFEHLAHVVDGFTEALGLEAYVLYVQDYGAPIGLRLAVRAPQRVVGLIVQNGNAYVDGLSSAWEPLQAYWREPTAERREQLRGWLTADGIRAQYVSGVPAGLLERFSPDSWTLDWSRLNRPGNVDVQLNLFGDYGTNVALYPQFQRFLREWRPPTLIAWGRHDPFFTEAGARAYLRDLPEAELHFLEAGHFALETHAAEISELVRRFVAERVAKAAKKHAAMDAP